MGAEFNRDGRWEGVRLLAASLYPTDHVPELVSNPVSRSKAKYKSGSFDWRLKVLFLCFLPSPYFGVYDSTHFQFFTV